jgi:hypothetical protein
VGVRPAIAARRCRAWLVPDPEYAFPCCNPT